MKKNNKKLITISSVILVVVTSIIIYSRGESGDVSSSVALRSGKEITIYQSSTCGCCGNYANYMRREGYSVKVVDESDMDNIKEKYGVPTAMESCHTTIAGNYVIEGHIPSVAVDKLLSEKPDIRGIAMPGMPSGSPGMPGPKQGSFKIFSVDNDGGTAGVFVTL